jgi:hypothetical protein
MPSVGSRSKARAGMARRTANHPVVASRDVDVLLAALGVRHERVETALEHGVVHRRKVGGQWLFFSDETCFDRAREAVGTVARSRLSEWFLTPTPWLRASIGKELHGAEVTRNAVEPLLRDFVARGVFGVIGLLTQEFEPYFALYNPDDQEEVTRQVDFMRDELARVGAVRPRDLPEPVSARTMDAWRGHALRHGEFLGLGSIQSGVLQAWNR